ncbi:right-handed parallel beta-helix repeat-containing protein, partial [Desulfosarcina sp.]|nr:right-handed parallel beta-helix repeat-containing protein [Desulfosarcina sp.]
GTSIENAGIYINHGNFTTLTDNYGSSSGSDWGDAGIILHTSHNNTLTSNIGVADSWLGIYLYISDNNTLTSSTAISASSNPLYVEDSDYNSIINNSLISSGGANNLLEIDSSSNDNTFCLNNFADTSGYYVNDGNGNNNYNCTYDGKNQGNIYYNVSQGNHDITGNVTSSITSYYIGEYGTDLPFNSTNSDGKLVGAVDYAPLTPTLYSSLSCGTLDQANTVYTMSSNLTSTGTCFTITAENVTLDCSGYTITGDNQSNSYGIYSNQYNTTIQNCNIENFDDTIYFDGASNSLIENVNATTTYSGATNIVLESSTDNQLNNIRTNATQGRGIVITSNSHRTNITGLTVFGGNTAWIHGVQINSKNTTIDCQGGTILGKNATNVYGIDANQNGTQVKNCNVNNFDSGIYLDGVSGGLIENINTSSTYSNAANVVLSDSTDNQLNNIWINSSQGRGIVITTNSYRNNITELTVFGGNTAWQHAIQISSINNTIDCQGGTLTGKNVSDVYGIDANQNGTQVKNCNIENFYHSIYFDGVVNGLIVNVNTSTTHSNGYNIILTDSTDNQLNNIWTNSTQYRGILFTSNSHRNNITGLNGFAGSNADWDDDDAVRILSGRNNTIDCQGGTLTGGGKLGNDGIYSTQNGTTVKNCNVNEFHSNIYFSGANNGLIENINLSGATGNGLVLSSATDNQVNTIKSNLTEGTAIRITSNSHRNNVTSLTTVGGNSGPAVYVDGGRNNTVDCEGGTLTGTNTTSIYGITIAQNETTIKNCNLNNFHIGFRISGASNGLIENVNVSSTNSVGVYMTTSTDNTFRNLIINSTKNVGININSNSPRNNFTGLTVYSGSTSADHALYLYGGRNNTFDCAGGRLAGQNASTSRGIYATENGTTIKNCRIDSYNMPIGFYGVNDGLVQNNTLIRPDVDLLYLNANSGSNTIILNNFTTTSGLYVADYNGNNFYNGTYEGKNQGNLYANIASYNISGSTDSSITGYYIGTVGSDYPYNNTNGAKVSVGVIDYAPLTQTNNPPSSATVTLSTPSNTNLTTQNITATITGSIDAEEDKIYNITDWRLNGTSIAVLNMPFDSEITSTATGAIRDYSTFENNGTLTNAPTWNNSCIVGGCYNFDGIDDYIDLGDDSDFQMGTDDFSISLWFYFNGEDQEAGMVSKRRNAAGYYQYSIGIMDDAQAGGLGKNLTVFIRDDTWTNQRQYTSPELSIGWHHVAIITDYDTDLRVYIDGILKGTDTTEYTAGINSVGYPLEIGRVNVPFYFNGSIDEVLIT